VGDGLGKFVRRQLGLEILAGKQLGELSGWDVLVMLAMAWRGFFVETDAWRYLVIGSLASLLAAADA
jgi:hypothetical protein